MTISDTEWVLSELTLEEKILLTAGSNFWETVPIPRLGLPSIKFSDGPNAVRGSQFSHGPTAACFPAAVALAASWDNDLVFEVGKALGEEASTKSADVILGPTVCPHRSPLGGRNFESFSEDPLIAGTMGAQYILGVQSQGVGTAIKHFAANEQETKRYTINAEISERALREIYLKPFEIAIKKAKPWAVMTSYNLVNGVHADMSDYLLQQVLRKEWRFNGMVLSDWGGVNSTTESIVAGLSLEMPGPSAKRKSSLVKSEMQKGKLDISHIDSCVRSLLELVQRCRKSGRAKYHGSEKAEIVPQHQELIRRAGSQAIVLLKNEADILPLEVKRIKSISAVGLASECLAHGGGSAAANPHYKITPLAALREALSVEGILVKSAEGVNMTRNLVPLSPVSSGQNDPKSWTLSRYPSADLSSMPLQVRPQADMQYVAYGEPCAAFTIEGSFMPPSSGNHWLGLSSLGTSKVFVDGELVLECTTRAEDPMAFLLGSAPEKRTQFKFEEGKPALVRLESCVPSDTEGWNMAVLEGVPGALLGFMLEEEMEKDHLTDAVEAARNTDVAIVFVGHTPVWETEGQDQVSMSLPVNGSQDRLIEAVCEVNRNVIVVNQTGVPIAMPWIGRVPAILQSWYLGQESGNSIADVLLGNTNPSGKLPVTFPRSLEDTPAYENFPGDLQTLQCDYKEDIFVGYRYFDMYPEKALFPFGYGLSYTSFDLTLNALRGAISDATSSLQVAVQVSNTGRRCGAEVIQVYVSSSADAVSRPLKQLAGYAKVWLDPGQSKEVLINIDHTSFARWDEELRAWSVDEGLYRLWVGNSAQNLAGCEDFFVGGGFTFGP